MSRARLPAATPRALPSTLGAADAYDARPCDATACGSNARTTSAALEEPRNPQSGKTRLERMCVHRKESEAGLEVCRG